MNAVLGGTLVIGSSSSRSISSPTSTAAPRPASAMTRSRLDTPPATPLQAWPGRRTRRRRRFLPTIRWRRLGATIVLGSAAAIFAPVLAPYDRRTRRIWRNACSAGCRALARHRRARARHPLAAHLGLRVTLGIVALVSVVTAPSAWSSAAPPVSFGGWVEAALMRVTDVFLALPRLILALAFVRRWGRACRTRCWRSRSSPGRPTPGSRAPKRWRSATRLHRGGEARRRLAARLLLRHIVPLCLPSLIVRASLDMAGVILTAAGLGFLGLGVAAADAEWGAMIASGRQSCSINGGSRRCPVSPSRS